MLVSVVVWESHDENGLGAKIKIHPGARIWDSGGPWGEAGSTRTHDRSCPMVARFGS